MEPLEPDDPQIIGRYRLVGRLGAGGMGRVYLALSSDGRVVAIKLIHQQHVAEPMFRSRFRREVEAARLVSGAYTAAVMDADAEAEQPWLATVYVPGPSLREVIRSHGPLSVSSVRTLAAGLAAALREVHRVGLIHRDLTPANVLLTDDGPRVIDFGITRAVDSGTELTATGLIIGSPGFMSPEQVEGKDLTPASDVFSFGAGLFFAAVGSGPFGKVSSAALLYRVVHTDPLFDQLPAELRPLVEPCLSRNPAQRPTPEQLLDLLGPVRGGASWLPGPVRDLIENQNHQLRVLRDGTAAYADAGDPDMTARVGRQIVQNHARNAAQSSVRAGNSAGVGAPNPGPASAAPGTPPGSWTGWAPMPQQNRANHPPTGPSAPSMVMKAPRQRLSPTSAKYAAITVSLVVVVVVIVSILIALTRTSNQAADPNAGGQDPNQADFDDGTTGSDHGETGYDDAPLPSEFIGQWTATVTPVDGEGAHSYAVLVLGEGEVGDQVGTFLRFVSGCSAAMELVSVTDDTAVFTEVDQYSQADGHTCSQPESTTLTLDEAGTLHYETSDPARSATFEPGMEEVPEGLYGTWSGTVDGVEYPDSAETSSVAAEIEVVAGALGSAEVYVKLGEGCHHASTIAFAAQGWVAARQTRVAGGGCPLVPVNEVLLIDDSGQLQYRGTNPKLSGTFGLS
ncbi:protein kinase family protein [Actinoalloteichus hymeniacidonis]|uniref:Protein kinase family protein n=2 Tax=Actinoalloteichus hymeniacidonis TaxID=340345 RepID=A0AAC9HTX3_9PSEU|nr:protein kinase family protein [Actinoalloteichus hymeniacidonis]